MADDWRTAPMGGDPQDGYGRPSDTSGYSTGSGDSAGAGGEWQGRAAARHNAKRGGSGHGGGGGGRRGGGGGGGKHKRLKIVAGVVAGLLVVSVGGAYAYYQHLNGELTGSALHASGDKQPAKYVDKWGHSPINVLLLGSDSRAGGNGKLGGDSSTVQGQRADVEMLLHLSADRSNITVISIPRDLVVPMPSCAGANAGVRTKINSALLYGGTGCQVDAVQNLTGMSIDHMIMVNFEGVVKVSDAIGGVPVCVSSNVYDANSGLKLSKGTHVLKGDAALEFLRTRDAFNTGATAGTDVGRTSTQHMYMASAINAMEKSGVASSPTKVLSIMSGLLKSLTVSPEIKSIPKLGSLGWDLHQVPAKRIKFVTMQTTYDSGGNLIEAPTAPAVFKDIADDVSLTAATTTASASPKSSAAPSPTVSVDASTVPVTVYNGTTTTGWAKTVAGYLDAKGFTEAASGGNSSQGNAVASTSLVYPKGDDTQAKAVAAAIGLPGARLNSSASATGYTLTLGTDWTTGSTYPAPKSNGASDIADANSQTADQTGKCAPVGNVENIPVGTQFQTNAAGIKAQNTPVPGTNHHELTCGIQPALSAKFNCYATPAEAYALFPNRKNSAP